MLRSRRESLHRNGITDLDPLQQTSATKSANSRHGLVPLNERGRPLTQLFDALGPVDSKDSLLSANQIQGFFWEAALGVMDRLVLSDVAWERMAPLIIGRPDQKGSTGRDNRMFVEGVLWIVRTGSPWRDLPEAFGDWNSVFRRFSRWSIKGVWYRMFEAMSDDPDFEYLIIDSTIVRAHQHAAGAKKGGLKIKRSVARAVA
jgi:transposase